MPQKTPPSPASHSAKLYHALKSVWAFPVGLFALVCLLTALRVSGSSVGQYNLILNGSTYHDSNLLYGQPRPVRSDEWMENTPLTVAQAKNNFAPTNNKLGNGEDMTVITDVPYRGWSEIFHVQNWSFFILPLEQGFAFKWWIMGYLLITSCYLFVVKLWPGHKLYALLISIGLFLTPFVQWWYANGTLAPIYYSFFIMTILMHLEDVRTITAKVSLGVLLAYLLISFTLVFYPPFQIACGLAVAAFYIGYLICRHGFNWNKLLNACLAPALGSSLAAIVVIIFLITRSSTIHAITNTVYPGHRIVPSGGFSSTNFMSGFLNYQLQSGFAAANYWTNQSEASTFIFLWPFLFVPSLLLLVRQHRRKQPLAWDLLAISTLLIVFCARLFLPLPMIVAKLLLLSYVPHNRLLIGVGLLGIVQLVLMARYVRTDTFSIKFTALITLVTALIEYGVIKATRLAHPAYIQHRLYAYIAALIVTIVVMCILKGHHTLAAGLLLVLCLVSTFRVNPLYRGLGVLTKSPLISAIQNQDQQHQGAWATVGDTTFINLPIAAGVRSYTGTYPYPQLATWRSIDENPAYSQIYNRYAFALFSETNQVERFSLIQGDVFQVSYQACNQFFKTITNVVSQTALTDKCLTPTNTVNYPQGSFYFYKLSLTK